MGNLFDMIAEDEERMLAKTREEMAAEKAAWDALSDEERAARLAESEARWAHLDDLEAGSDDDDDDNEEEED